MRGISDSEFLNALESLEKEKCGCVSKVQEGRTNKQTIVFVKKKDLPEAAVHLVHIGEYKKKYCLPVHGGVSQCAKNQLQEKGLLSCDN